MGLRIIGRSLERSRTMSEEEQRGALERTMDEWIAARGGDTPPALRRDFLDHYQRAKSRLNGASAPDCMLAMATQLRRQIQGHSKDGFKSHAKVDVATLLELL